MAYQDVVQRARNAFQNGRTRSIAFRRQQLQSLMRMYEENRDLMAEVLEADLKKPRQESMIFEIDFLINDLINTLSNFESWAAAEKVRCFLISHSKLIYNSKLAGQSHYKFTRRSSHIQGTFWRCISSWSMELSASIISCTVCISNCSRKHRHSQAKRAISELC